MDEGTYIKEPARGYHVGYCPKPDPGAGWHETRTQLYVTCEHVELQHGALVIVHDQNKETWIPLSNLEGSISIERLTDDVDDLGNPDEDFHLKNVAQSLRALNQKTPDGLSGAGGHKVA